MGFVKWLAFLVLPVSLALYLHFFHTPPGPPPSLGRGWWSKEDEGGYRSEAIKPFSIQLSGGTLYNAWERLQKPRLFESLPDSNFEYGFNSEYMKVGFVYLFELTISSNECGFNMFSNI